MKNRYNIKGEIKKQTQQKENFYGPKRSTKLIRKPNTIEQCDITYAEEVFERQNYTKRQSAD